MDAATFATRVLAVARDAITSLYLGDVFDEIFGFQVFVNAE